MGRSFLCTIFLLAAVTSLTAGCITQPYVCKDSLGCVEVDNAETIKIATLLTMTTPDSPYGIDAVRGVEIAIADKKEVFGHPLELIKTDDLCSHDGGQQGATQLAANPKIVGVIGATCSSASDPAAKILSDAGMVMISPSSTAPSLTDPATHQAGFLRSIYNDQVQGQAVANFAFNVLGARRMATVHDGTPYPKQLQEVACASMQQLGGQCVQQIEITSGQDVTSVLQSIAASQPDVIYYPLYAVDGANITKGVAALGLNVALISSDGLLSTDFIQQTKPSSEGMYLSGPQDVKENADFLAKYKSKYGEDPIATYHLQAYDAAMMLFGAIEKVAIPDSSKANSISIPRGALRQALYAIQGMQGLSGPINCSSSGDCAQPNIEIFQVENGEFKAIYP
jgi:branched-chain amino acid transport system substrate-binding protein